VNCEAENWSPLARTVTHTSKQTRLWVFGNPRWTELYDPPVQLGADTNIWYKKTKTNWTDTLVLIFANLKFCMKNLDAIEPPWDTNIDSNFREGQFSRVFFWLARRKFCVAAPFFLCDKNFFTQKNIVWEPCRENKNNLLGSSSSALAQRCVAWGSAACASCVRALTGTTKSKLLQHKLQIKKPKVFR
jgi:hypothetical protein